MTTNLGSLAVKSPDEVRDDYLRTLRNGLIARGVTNPEPQLGPGSDDYIRATGLSNEISPIAANTQIKADAQMPDTAVGDDLVRQANLYGLSPRPASGSTGKIIYSASASGLVPTGSQLLDTTNLRYEVTVGGTYSNGALIPVDAIDTGPTTNHLAGDVLKWVSAPPYAAPSVLVATGGLTGAVDAEDDETLRARLVARLQNPPGGGNWQQIAEFAEASSTLVQKGFVYPAANGPSTVHVAVVGYATSTSKTRDIESITLNSVIIPYIQGLISEFAESVITTVTNVATDVSIGLSLPAAPTASPAGPGGGWLDGTPWPAISGTIATYANVSGVFSTTVFTVEAPSEPTDGVSQICFLDPTNWTLYSAKVLSHVTMGTSHQITIDTAFPNIAAAFALGGTGPLIFPAAVNTATYITAILSAFAMMGPGEKVSSVDAGFVRGFRHPVPQLSWPFSLGAVQLRAITNAGSEVLDTNYYYRSATTPAVPGAVASPPNCIIPRHIGLYSI